MVKSSYLFGSLFAFLILVFTHQVFAGTCPNDPNECTPKNLCAAATSQKGGITIWSDASSAAKHVDFAKELGINCGVVEIVDPCDADAKECKISQLCEKATLEVDGVKSWNDEAKAYVSLAKDYGLNCNILLNGEKTEDLLAKEDGLCDYSDFSECTTSELCEKSAWGTDIKNWYADSNKYVIEAKRRGLHCNIAAAAEQKADDLICFEDLAQCSAKQLCEQATIGSTTPRWHSETNLFVQEAKRLGLRCGVRAVSRTATGSSVTSTTVNCGVADKYNTTQCTDKSICLLATTGYWGNKNWQKNSQYLPFVAEAALRSLNCDLQNKASKPVATNLTSFGLREAFISQSKLKRKQIQYALKELNLYRYSIDGLWGKGTEAGIKTFTKEFNLTQKSESQVFSFLLSKVNTPATFATPKRAAKTTTSSTTKIKAPYGWRLVTNNPMHSYEQANAICKPMSQNAGNSVRMPNTNNNYNCYGSGNSFNCNNNASSPEAAFINGLARGMMKSKTRRRAYASCMAQYGWVED